MTNTSSKSLTRRVLLGIAAFALVLAALTGAMVGDVDAAGEYVETTYYSDASKTEPIGVRIQTCNGNLLRYGSVSRFHDTISFPCF